MFARVSTSVSREGSLMFAVEMKQVCKLVPSSSGLKGGMSHLAVGFVKAFLSAIRLHFLTRSVCLNGI